MHHSAALGASLGPVVAISRRAIPTRHHGNHGVVSCSAIPAPSTSQPEQPSTPRLPTLWARIAAAKAKCTLAGISKHAPFLKNILIGPRGGVPAGSGSGSGSGRTSTLPLLLLGAVPPALLPPSFWHQLGANYVFMAGFWGWFLAQFLKIFTKWYKTGVFTVRAFVDSGGMPSSHSSLCSAVTMAVALQQGLSSPLFAMCTCFSVIVMYDAMGVRRHAGLQAEVLNAVVEDLLDGDHPVSEKKLKEVLGHTPRQVLCGCVLGLVTGYLYPRPF